MLLKKGFTLLEVIVVIVILSLFFGVLIGSYFFIINKSLKTIKGSKDTYDYANLIYNLERAVLCSKDLKIDNSKDFSTIYMYTSCGVYNGFSKEGLFVKDGYLYMYSYPYKIGDLFFYDDKKSIKLIPAYKFSAKFLVGSTKTLDVKINNISLKIPIIE